MESLLRIVDSTDNNSLHRSVQENCLEAVKFFVKKGVNTTNTIKEGQTPLYIAVTNNHQDIMSELCKNKSREELRNLINRRTANTGSAALHAAAQNNSLEMTKFLLSHGAIFDIRDKPKRRPEQLTTDESIRELFKTIEELFDWVLFADDDNVPQDPQDFCSVDNLAAVTYARDSQNRTALQLAMEKNQLHQAATIIECRIEKLKQDDWQLGMDFFKLAHYSEAARLHLSNLDALHYDEDNDLAVRKEVLDLLGQAYEFLEAYKTQADPSLDNQPLLITIEESLEFFGSWKGSNIVIDNQRLNSMLKNRVAFIILALKLSIIAPMQLFMRQVYTSELLEAAKRNDLTLVERCLIGHPKVNEKNADDRTALRFAFEYKNYEMAKMLLAVGADPTREKIRHNEPFLYFALRHILESTWSIDAQVIQLLFDRVCDDEKSISFVNAKATNDGATALHLVSRHSNHRLAQFLLSKGAIYCAKDSHNGTSEDYCGQHEGIRRLFREINRLFAHANDGQNKELIEAMEKLDVLDLLAAAGARNGERQTLIQVLELKGHVDEAEQIRKLMSSDEADRCKRSAAEFLCHGPNVVRYGVSFHRE